MAVHQNDRTALILYGSETGDSQNVAEELERITERLRFNTRVIEMDAVEVVRGSILKDILALSLNNA